MRTIYIKQEHMQAWGQPTLLCQRSLFYLNLLVKKVYNSKNIVFRIMSLVLQLQLVIMSKYSMFDVDTFNTFWVMGYIKIYVFERQWQQQWPSYHNRSTVFLRNRRVTMHFGNETSGLNSESGLTSEWSYFRVVFIAELYCIQLNYICKYRGLRAKMV